MVPNVDVQRLAWLMIRRYGDDAVPRAVQHGDAMLDRGNMYGLLTWIAIIRVIERFQATEPGEEDTVQ